MNAELGRKEIRKPPLLGGSGGRNPKPQFRIVKVVGVGPLATRAREELAREERVRS